MQNSGANTRRGNEEDWLFDIVIWTDAHARPHPEERACRRLSAESHARARVSKDEDGRRLALMLRDASQRFATVEGVALAWRCAAPQHEGGRGRRILAKRTKRAFWRNGPTPKLRGRSEQRTNLWV